MSLHGDRHTVAPSSVHSHLMIPIFLLFALLVVAVLRSPSLVTSSGLGSAVIVAAPLILAAFALTPIAMAGRGGVDLSIGPLIGFINVTLVQLNAEGIVTSVVDVFLYALGVGVAYQIVMGLIIVYVRIQPIIVALAGFLTLAGLNLVILPRPGGVAPEWMQSWGLGVSIWSPVLAILAVAVGAWFLFTRTAFYDHLRMMGADERTAYTAGVDVVAVRMGAHVIAGLYAGLAALAFTSLIGSGDPTQGSTYTLMAVTALVLGGTSLAGGRGSVTGSLLGALNIYLITYVLATFHFGMVQSFVTQLAYGVILVVALLLTIFLPQVQRAIRGISPYVLFVALALVAAGVVLYAQDDVAAPPSGGVASLSAASSASLSEGSATSLSASSATSLSADSATSLSGTSLSASTLSPETEGELAAPTATPIVIATVIVAAAMFLAYLLWRHPGPAPVALIAVTALLMLGYSVHDGGLPTIGTDVASWVGQRAAIPPFFAVGVASAGMEDGAVGPLWLAIVPAGAILVSTVLIFTALPYPKRFRIGPTALAFTATAGALAALALAYTRSGEGGLSPGVVGIAIVGIILFVVALPAFQRRVSDVTSVALALLAVAVLAAMLFAAGPQRPPGAIAAIDAHATAAGELTTGAGILPDTFFVEAFSVLAATVILYLLAIPGVRRHAMHNVSFDPRVRGFSYTSIFIAVAAVVGLGAIFLVADVRFWKFVVALVAGVIGAKFALHFLLDFRRKNAGRGPMGANRRDFMLHIGDRAGP